MKEENERMNVCGDKVRGFYRPPAATMVVGRRKLLALVANDRLLGISVTWLPPPATLTNILTNNIRVIKGDDALSCAFFSFTIINLSQVIVHARQRIQSEIPPRFVV